MTIDARSFRNALGCFATGVTVVTSMRDDDRPAGVTVSAFSSLSLDPPLVMFALGKATSALSAYTEGSHFTINVLGESQREMSIHFASKKSGKFQDVPYDMGENGCPLLPGCLAHLQCRRTAVLEGGDHVIIVGEVERLDYNQGGQPLLYFRGAYYQLGSTEY